MEKISLPKGLASRVAAHNKGAPLKKERHLHSEAHALADEQISERLARGVLDDEVRALAVRDAELGLLLRILGHGVGERQLADRV